MVALPRAPKLLERHAETRCLVHHLCHLEPMQRSHRAACAPVVGCHCDRRIVGVSSGQAKRVTLEPKKLARQ
eukprot:9063827-Heterocapsa_arctica.AAC.1